MTGISGRSGQSDDKVCEKPIDETTPDAGVVAIVQGQVVEKLPNDLYIPPDALQVFLEAFEGPLDLSLIHISEPTRPY